MSHIRGEPVYQEVVDIKLSYCSNSHVLPSYTVIMVLLINAVTRKECLQHCNIVTLYSNCKEYLLNLYVFLLNQLNSI